MSFLSSIGSLVAQRGVQAIGAGLLSGAIGGAVVVASGVLPFGGSQAADPTMALTACPGSGPVLARIPSGQALLATARSADGAWLQVYVGQPGLDRGWAPARALRLDSAADGLPIADCAAPTGPALLTPDPRPTATPPAPSPSATAAATDAPSSAPDPSPTPSATVQPTATVKPTPTPKPTPTAKPMPTPTPTPTPAPDTTPPTLSNLTTTGFPFDGQYYIYGPSAPCTPHAATISVTATDAGGIQSVTLYYWPGGAAVASAPMSAAGSNTWQATITAQDSWAAGQNGLINYWVRATDSSGNEAQLDHSNAYRLYKGDCIT